MQFTNLHRLCQSRKELNNYPNKAQHTCEIEHYQEVFLTAALARASPHKVISLEAAIPALAVCSIRFDHTNRLDCTTLNHPD
jgi:hypothetical protein